MARELKVEFEHAVYDTFSFQHGAPLTVAQNKLGDLLIAADNATDREPGFFFETIDGQFVFGFQRKREDDHGKSRGMAYFDVFVTPVTQVRDVPLNKIKESLESEMVPNFGTEPGLKYPQFKYEVTETPAPTQVDHKFIAESWELYRRESGTLYLSLDQLQGLVDAIDGLFSKISFVSCLGNNEIDSNYFKVVDSVNSNPHIQVPELRQQISNLQQQGKLSYTNLPTYEEVLEAKREERKNALNSIGREREIEELLQEIENKVKQRFRNYPEQGKQLFDQGLENDIRDAEAQEESEYDNKSLYAGFALAVLVVGFGVATIAGLLSNTIPTLFANLVVGAAGTIPIFFLIQKFELLRATTNLDRRELLIEGGIFSAIALSVIVIATLVAPIVGVSGLALPTIPITFNPVWFGGAVIGLFAGYGGLRFTQNLKDENTGDTIFVKTAPQNNIVDEEVVSEIEDSFQSESDAIDQWIEEKLLEYIESELQQISEKQAQEAADQTVNELQNIKQTRAYKQSSDSNQYPPQ